MTRNTQEIQKLIRLWTSDPFDEATRQEIQALVDAGNVTELEDRFRCDLEFGTGGMRGILGAGTNRMNRYTVSWAAQGLATYVSRNATRPGPLRVVISYDCRHGSREFAETVAGVFAANGFIAHIFEALRPTPELSFAVRRLGAHTGVMLTASHNPKQYNGLKAYWDDGSQVIYPYDEGIVEEVKKVAALGQVHQMDFQLGVARKQIQYLGKEIDRLFLEALAPQRLHPELADGPDGCRMGIVFTPLHGTGGTLAPAALERWGFTNVLPVEEQMRPDGDFPTAKSPNPEEGAALEQGVELARKANAELVLATDPDADRLGIAVRHKDEFHVVTGNQLCALLADYIFGQRKLDFSQVVAVPYPRKGLWQIGFITGPALGAFQAHDPQGREFITVFVPTSPTPCTGYVVVVPKEEILNLPMTIDQAFRFLLSGGVINPEVILLPADTENNPPKAGHGSS